MSASLYTAQDYGNVSVLAHVTGEGECQRPCTQHRLRGTSASLHTSQVRGTVSLHTAQVKVNVSIFVNGTGLEECQRRCIQHTIRGTMSLYTE